MKIPDELNERLRTLKDALAECFGEYSTGDNGALFVECCGKVTYGSGIMGTDIAQCEKCKRAVVNILSPHVSPLLIQGSVTHAPPDDFIKAIGVRCWVVYQPEEQTQ